MASHAINRSDPVAAGKPWVKLMGFDEDILEWLEQDARWWRQAALHCERGAACLPSGEREDLEWQLLGAVYRERANISERLIERLRRGVSGDVRPNRESDRESIA
jgi:hypothetical protein